MSGIPAEAAAATDARGVLSRRIMKLSDENPMDNVNISVVVTDS
jgi:hypothetical protein